jgi:hypothetical protein
MLERNPVDDFIKLNPKTGMYDVIPWMTQVQPNWLYADEQYYPDGQAITIPAAGSAKAIYKIKHSSLGVDKEVGTPFLMDRILFEDSVDTTAAAAFSISLVDLGDKTQFMNNPIHIRLFAATSQLPGMMSEMLMMPSRHALLATFAKLSGGATSAKMWFAGKAFYPYAPELNKFPQDRQTMIKYIGEWLERRKHIAPFWITTNTNLLAQGNQTVEADMLVGDDGHFEGSHLVVLATSMNFEFQIYNPLTKQTYMNIPIHADANTGDASNPQEFAIPLFIPSGNRVRVRVTDLSGSANTIYFALRGRKIRAPLKDVEAVKKSFPVPTIPLRKEAKK